MDIGFVNFGPLAWSRSPRIRFLSIGSRFCSTLSSDPSSRTSPLRFANPSPPSGWVEDFHLQASGHTRHTKHTAPLGQPDRELRLLQTYWPAGAAGSGPRLLLRKESWDAGPGRPAVRPLRLRAARTGLFTVSGGTGFAIMDYKHMGPTGPGRAIEFRL